MKFRVVILLSMLNIISHASLNVCYRCDDVWMQIDGKNDSIFRLFKKYSIPLTCGVIPFDSCGNIIIRNDARLEQLKNLQSEGLIEIALHGYAHYLTGTHGELDGLDYGTQLYKLSKGKHVLDSIFQTNVITFIPPYNWYDENTIRALEQIGIVNISADPEEEFPLVCTKIKYLPYSVGELRKMPTEIRCSHGGG